MQARGRRGLGWSGGWLIRRSGRELKRGRSSFSSEDQWRDDSLKKPNESL
jgi:hypothetical protein